MLLLGEIAMFTRLFFRTALVIALLLPVLPFIPLQATELFAVGSYTAEYFDGTEWIQLYGAKPYETNRLLGVWGASETNIYVVGTNGTIAHYYGITWNDMSSGTSARLESIWGSSWFDIFTVGAEGTILHYDSYGWSAMSSGTTLDLYDIWGASDTDVYAVGDGIVLHFDGSSWSELDIGYSGTFKAVWVSPDGKVFIASGPDIIYYNGNSWRILENKPGTMWIYDIWGSSADDVFFACTGSIILHYDNEFTSTNVGSAQLLCIGGNNSNDVYVCDASGNIYHYDGSTWTHVVYIDSPYSPYSSYFNDIFAISATNIIAAGWDSPYADIKAIIYQFDGIDWSYIMPDAFPRLTHVWANSINNVFAAGIQEEGYTTIHYDGRAWSKIPIPTTDRINDIWGTSYGHAFAVTREGDDPSQVLHYDGSAWSVMAEFYGSLERIWGNSGADIYVIGGYLLHHFDGRGWSEIEYPPVSGGGEAVYATPDGEIFVLGVCGGSSSESPLKFAYYYDGSEWTSVMEYYSSMWSCYTAWGSSREEIYFTIDESTFHYNGVTGQLTDISRPDIDPWNPVSPAMDIWGDPDGNLYIATWSDEIYHYDGSEWSTLYTGNGESIRGIWGWGDSATDAAENHAVPFSLNQNYPNPFNPSTTIEYHLEREGQVTLEIFDTSGRLICRLLDKVQIQGRHTITWEGQNAAGHRVASGVYFCRIKTSSGIQSRKMVLAR